MGSVIASIREVHINVSNYSAEYGGAAGGVINAITKSGTNTFHGSAFSTIATTVGRAQSAISSVLINGARLVCAETC